MPLSQIPFVKKQKTAQDAALEIRHKTDNIDQQVARVDEQIARIRADNGASLIAALETQRNNLLRQYRVELKMILEDYGEEVIKKELGEVDAKELDERLKPKTFHD